MIVEDPDTPAGTWVHWVLYGIPATLREPPEGVATRDAVTGLGIQGVNDFRAWLRRPLPATGTGSPLLL